MSALPGIRAATPDDLPGMKRVVEATALFPADLLDGMTAPHFAGEGEEVWLVAEENGVRALAFVAPERMTEGTCNLLLIAVHPAWQSRGLGAALVAAVEDAVVARGARLLLVETSGLPDFARTRAFYPRCGFAEEARIRDFYRAGEDKIVFRKALAGRTSPDGGRR